MSAKSVNKFLTGLKKEQSTYPQAFREAQAVFCYRDRIRGNRKDHNLNSMALAFSAVSQRVRH